MAGGGNVRGAVGGIGIGGGGLNVVGRPGVNPEAGGAVPVGAGAPGGGAKGGAGGVDVSGNFNIAVKSDTEMFTFEVQKIVRATVRADGDKGAMG